MPSFEETDARIRNACRDCGGGGAKAAAVTPPAGPLAPVCSVYAIIKPILQGLEAIPFFPTSWKTAISDFFKVMDVLCPASPAHVVAAPNLTYDSIDAQVKQALIAFWQSPSATPQALAAVAAAPGLNNVLGEICKVYKAIKPILDLAKTFVPGPWGIGIGIAEQILDALCAGK
jgi:hypothetical protein